MSAEAASSSIARLAADGRAGVLLDTLSRRLQADAALEAGRSAGLVQTLGYAPNNHSVSGIDEYQPGIDMPQDLDIAETHAAKRPMARKGVGDTGVGSFSLLAEYDRRYDGSTGLVPLHGLARMSVAMTMLAAQKIGSGMQTVVASEAGKPFELSQRRVDPIWTLRQYDRQVERIRSSGKAAGAQSVALAQGLKFMNQEGPRKNTDAALVISDFLMGAERSQDGTLQGFNWERPLRELREKFEDRLFVVRLTTPAQTQLPNAARLQVAGQTFDIDAVERANASERYLTAAQEKAARISDILHGTRLLELDSMSRRPATEVINFVFGEPIRR